MGEFILGAKAQLKLDVVCKIEGGQMVRSSATLQPDLSYSLLDIQTTDRDKNLSGLNLASSLQRKADRPHSGGHRRPRPLGVAVNEKGGLKKRL